jgi:hypothetical protein
MPAPALNDEVSSILHRCLSPDPAARPSAAALLETLSGRNKRAEATKISARPPGQPLVTDGIELLAADGRALHIGVRTELGKALVRQLGADGEFWDDRQCVLERQAGRQWVVSPVAGTTNETLVNGKTLRSPYPLRQGDLIAVGRQDKGVIKLPLTARGR